MGPSSLIVMLTDFGIEHWYDAAMKGEILRRVPYAKILDLSHHVPRQNIESAAFILHCAIDSFPRGTIFCCVVDPGVGSRRRSLVGRIGEFAYVGPDNGLVTPLLERDPHVDLFEIKSPTFRNPVVSATFHGRDIFAPAAARLVLGDDPRMAGPRVTDPVRLPPFRARREPDRVVGKVMLVDHFGNAITNVGRGDFESELGARGFELALRELRLSGLSSNYSEATPGQPICYWGSSAFLEIAINFGSAAETYAIEVGDPVTITLGR